MTYSTEVLADTPAVWIRGADALVTPNGYADSSGNSRHLSLAMQSGGDQGVSLAALPAFVAGPKKRAMAFGTSAIALRTSYTQTQPTVGTYEGWINFASNPAADVTLWTWATPPSGSIGTTSSVTLTSAGKIAFATYDGSVTTITSPSALTTGAWHHVVASIGAAGTKIRVDKVSLVTGAKTSATVFSGAAFWVHGQYNGSGFTGMTGAMSIAESAFYATQLSDTRTDAHFDAASDAILTGTWGMAS